MGEPRRQYQPIDLLEFKRRLLARTESLPTPAEDPLAELARIIGGEGRIVSADADPRDEASSGGRTPVEAQAARPPKTDLEPLQWPDWPAEDQSPHYAAVDPPFSDHADLGESAHEEWRSHADRAPYGDEDLLVAPSRRCAPAAAQPQAREHVALCDRCGRRDRRRPCGFFRPAGRFCGLAGRSSCRHGGSLPKLRRPTQIRRRRPGRTHRRLPPPRQTWTPAPSCRARRRRCPSATRAPPRRRRLRQRIRRHLRKTTACFCSRGACRQFPSMAAGISPSRRI